MLGCSSDPRVLRDAARAVVAWVCSRGVKAKFTKEAKLASETDSESGGGSDDGGGALKKQDVFGHDVEEE